MLYRVHARVHPKVTMVYTTHGNLHNSIGTTPSFYKNLCAEAKCAILHCHPIKHTTRIFPDNYLDLNYLQVMSMIEESEEEEDVDFVGIVSAVQAATSIGYEGRGRFDILEIAGVAHEEEMEKLSKELGL